MALNMSNDLKSSKTVNISMEWLLEIPQMCWCDDKNVVNDKPLCTLTLLAYLYVTYFK